MSNDKYAFRQIPYNHNELPIKWLQSAPGTVVAKMQGFCKASGDIIRRQPNGTDNKAMSPKKTYEDAVRTEATARKYLLGFCWKNHQRFCPRCRTRKLYRLADGRYRCPCCRYTFHDLSRRWISLVNITCGQWLRLVKFHQLNVPARRAAAELGVSVPTACRGYRVIGLARKTSAIAAFQSDDPFTRAVRQLTNFF